MPDYAYLLENRLSVNQRSVLEKVRHVARDHGMTVFLAGGAVRDLTTGFPVRDLDFTVQGNAFKLKKSLEKAGAELWGEHEPSRTLFLWYRGVRFEVSSARREDFPKPGKPVYHWAAILEDLRRRDFTANAMAVSLNEGSYGLLLDPLNGIADLDSRTLRLVNPYGFLDEPSRLLRAIRFEARTGWEMDERTKSRYQNAKDEGVISSISPYLKGYELEEIVHEEDALKVLKALEAEGWMKQIFPAWIGAKADTKGLEALHSTLLDLLIQGIHPDLSAAHMELLTAKLSPKELSSLKRLFPQPGFIQHWEHLERSTKDFQKELLDKKNAAPSATWKLLTTYAPEPVLWLACTNKNAQVQTKFKNFLTVWPEARQKIPTLLMQEMRITPDLPGYDDLVQQIFFALMDGKLTTDEEMRAFLEPHSPPAPPPPVTIRRTRAKKARIVEEELEEHGEGLEGRDLHDEDHEDHEDEEHDEASIALPPVKKPSKAAKAEAPKPSAAQESPKPAKPSRAPEGKPAKTPAEKPSKATPEKQEKKASAKETAAHKPVATKNSNHKPAAKPAPAKKQAKPAPKPQKKAAAKPAEKAAAKPAKKAVPHKAANKPAKSAKKKRESTAEWFTAMLAKLFRSVVVASLLSAFLCFAIQASAQTKDPRLAGSYRFERDGWTYVHLQGTPEQIGFQHGYLLAPEIADFFQVLKVESEHSTSRKWQFFRDAGRTILWPHIDREYRQELEGIAAGVAARGVNLDLWDIVAMNGEQGLREYYVPWLDRDKVAKNSSDPKAPGNCSAFIATGSYTKDGKIVIAHSNWSSYAEGSRWVIVFDIVPTHGHRILMDGAPGLIDSADDFGINDAGIMITETTISQFIGWNSNGIPEFVRARKAMQYAGSIDEYVAIMRKGNNGAYANDWLIGDRKTGEIAYLELGLKHTPLWRKKDGYFISSNFPRDPGVIQDETEGFDPTDKSSSPNARRVRWQQLMQANKGKIDVPMAEQFLSDHEDSFLHEQKADQRSLCGHVDAAKEGVAIWGWGPYYPGGAVQGKATDSDMTAHMSFVARAGHPCGESFYAKPFLAAHPEYAWQAPILKDMPAGPWATFTAGEK